MRRAVLPTTDNTSLIDETQLKLSKTRHGTVKDTVLYPPYRYGAKMIFADIFSPVTQDFRPPVTPRDGTFSPDQVQDLSKVLKVLATRSPLMNRSLV